MENAESIFQALIAKGNTALDAFEDIAPHAVSYQECLLKRLLKESKDTEFGRKHAFANIADYAQYRQLVPLTTYADYKDYVDRLAQTGEQHLLTAAEVVHFCPTTGTTSAPKLIPVVEEAKRLIASYTLPTAFAMGAKHLQNAKREGFTDGKCLFLLEVGQLSYTESGIPIGGISSTAVRGINDLLESFCSSPREIISPDAYLNSKYLHLLFALKDPNITVIATCYMTTISGVMDEMTLHWEDLCNDIEAGTINPEIEMSDATREALSAKLTPDPARAAQLREIFSGGFEEPIVPKIWPRLSFIVAIGTGAFAIHTQMVRRFVGPDVPICHDTIAASESIMAIADGCNTDEFILLPQAAFFEFLPEDACDESEMCTMETVEVGKRYEIVLTTLSGLYRYRMNDIVEISGFHGQIPKVRFACRANVFIDIAGEKTTEANLYDAISVFSEQTGMVVSDYAAYADMEKAPGHYVVLIEPDADVDASRIPEYEAAMEEALCLNFGYKYERLANNIDHVKLLIQQGETHQLYHELQIMKGANRNQLKPVKVLDTEQKRLFFTAMLEEM